MKLSGVQVASTAAAVLASASRGGTAPAVGVLGFAPSPLRTRAGFVGFPRAAAENEVDVLPDAEEDESLDPSTSSSPAVDPRVVELKRRLLSLSDASDRGFSATKSQREEARSTIFDLAKYNPTAEPAFPYYEGAESGSDGSDGPTLAGKWTLVYTDAPDITSLDTSSSPLPTTAELGRIGQECSPPLIKNIIEWKRPSWLPEGLPLSGKKGSRVLQKVCVEGKASPGNPKFVELTVAGIDLAGDAGGDDGPADDESGGKDEGIGGFLPDALKNGPASFFASNPVELRGPLSGSIPFGRFEILYLDEEMRVIQTGQNYLAANVRLKEGEEWF
uniref:Plastid lipid-associated protein/fibrillin conserved domain-containing protein n=1 Tax=Odontella aurita TaxID=265563 RepID=A0A7S4JN60_9STRA|mmetsp:Transcript_50006/g.150429  ORF Transcript_50006/g.150429 Transcript_50006/m.150429 type:complete len:332 (+) Transcript_50006:141-1136(+)